MTTLHLMTQRDQPYGSRRKCCERCGLMLVARPDSFWREHTWTDEELLYRHHPAELPHFQHELVPCSPMAGGKTPNDRVQARPEAVACNEGLAGKTVTTE